MNREQIMVIFEKACADWGFDFEKDLDHPDGLMYANYDTGTMFGMFLHGFKTAKEQEGVER